MSQILIMLNVVHKYFVCGKCNNSKKYLLQNAFTENPQKQ